MKKVIIFISGIFAAPLVFLAYVLLLAPFPMPPHSALLGPPQQQSVTSEDAQPSFRVRAKLDISSIAKESLPAKPWQLFLLVTLSTNAWGDGNRLLRIPVGEVDSFPFDAAVDIGLPALYNSILSSEESFKNSKDSQEISLTFLLGQKPLEDFMLDRIEENKLVDARVPAYFFRTETFVTVSEKRAIKERSIDLGSVYFREFYKTTDIVPGACPLSNQVTAKISDPTGEFYRLSQKNVAILVRVPEEFYLSFFYTYLITAIAQDDYGGLFRELTTIPAGTNNTNVEFRNTTDSSDGMFSHYVVVFCGKKEQKKTCLNKFGRDYFKLKKYASDQLYYPLIPAALEAPRCDKLSLDFFFYPFKRALTEPNQFLPKQKNSSLPSEIIEGDGDLKI